MTYKGKITQYIPIKIINIKENFYVNKFKGISIKCCGDSKK